MTDTLRLPFVRSMGNSIFYRGMHPCIDWQLLIK